MSCHICWKRSYQNDTTCISNSNKLNRLKFTKYQTLRLEEAFSQKSFIDAPEAEALAKELDVSARQIRTWFQNKRAKMRRKAFKASGRPYPLTIPRLPQLHIHRIEQDPSSCTQNTNADCSNQNLLIKGQQSPKLFTQYDKNSTPEGTSRLLTSNFYPGVSRQPLREITSNYTLPSQEEVIQESIDLDPSNADKFSIEQNNELLTFQVSGNDKSFQNFYQQSFYISDNSLQTKFSEEQLPANLKDELMEKFNDANKEIKSTNFEIIPSSVEVDKHNTAFGSFLLPQVATREVDQCESSLKTPSYLPVSPLTTLVLDSCGTDNTYVPNYCTFDIPPGGAILDGKSELYSTNRAFRRNLSTASITSLILDLTEDNSDLPEDNSDLPEVFDPPASLTREASVVNLISQ